MFGRKLLVLAALVLTALPWGSAQAGVRIGIGVPYYPYYHRHYFYPRVIIAAPPIVIAPAPVYAAPAPVYVVPAPRPVYVQPAPMVVTPTP